MANLSKLYFGEPIYVEARPGHMITHCIQDALDYSKEINQTVILKANGTEFTLRPTTTKDDLNDMMENYFNV